jgi:hypothetical protein
MWNFIIDLTFWKSENDNREKAGGQLANYFFAAQAWIRLGNNFLASQGRNARKIIWNSLSIVNVKSKLPFKGTNFAT